MSRERSRERDKWDREYTRERPRERDGRDHKSRDKDRDRDRHKGRHKERHRDKRSRSRSKSRERLRSSDHAARDRDRHRERDKARVEGDRQQDHHRERSHKAADELGSKYDSSSRKRPREGEGSREDREASAQKQKLDEQAALDAEMEKRRKRVEEWRRQRQLQEEQAAAAAEAAEAAAAGPATAGGKGWSLEDESDGDEAGLEGQQQEDDGQQQQDQQQPAQQQPEQKEQQQEEAAEEDEPDPLDAFMAGNAAALETEAAQAAATTAAATAADDAVEEDSLDAFMAAQVLPEVSKAKSEPAIATTAPSAAGAAPADATAPPPAAADNSSKQAVAGPKLISSRSMVFIRPSGLAAAAAGGKQLEGRRPRPAARRRRTAASSEESSDVDDSDEENDAPSDDEEWARNLATGKSSKMEKLINVDHAAMNYAPFRKNFYIEAPDIKRMTEQEVVELRKELDGLKVRGKHCPRPIKAWTQAGLTQKVLEVLRKAGAERPLPIQAQALPIIMSGRDCIGIAKTGSGKTLAFVLPMLRHVKDQPPVAHGDGPIALVMAPTRELVQQIAREVKRFSKALDLSVVAVFGGSGVANQISELKRGAEVVAATPGRLIDLLVTGAGRIINLQRVTFFVLDEADRMFDMGFEPQIMRVVNNIRPDRQTVMFSATFPRSVETLARQALKEPVEIQVGGRSVVNADIEQFVEIRPEADRFLRLLEVLGEWFERGKIIVFVHSQEKCDNLFRDLIKAGYPCLSLHGGKDQSDRESTIADFKSNVCNILVATSVAARGLDVKELVLVVNYDVPNHHEDYVHRVGRTGRAGNKGTAITFIGPEEEKYAPDLVKALQESKAPIPQDLQTMADAHMEKRRQGLVQGHGSGYGGSGFKFDKDEDQKIKKARRAKAKEYGVVDEEEEDKSSSDDDIRPAGANAAATAAAAATNGLPSAAQAAAAPSAPSAPLAVKFLPAQPGQVYPGQAVTQDSSSILAAAQRAAQEAAARAGVNAPQSVIVAAAQQAAARAAEVAAKLTGQAIPITGVPAASAALMASAAASASAGLGLSMSVAQQQRASGFEAELEINDFPQQARYKVTHKGFQSEITELTGAAVTTKGIYVKAGNPPDGERKLYLLIEGPTEQAVRRAKQELKKVIEEITEKAMRRDVGAAGRYQI